MYVKEHQCVMSSFKEQLTNERLQILGPARFGRKDTEAPTQKKTENQYTDVGLSCSTQR